MTLRTAVPSDADRITHECDPVGKSGPDSGSGRF
jgi:hypothetical protein